MTNREDGYMTERCTDWSKYDVPTIWSTVSDEGDAVSYAQVTAWRETAEAIDRHSSILSSALDELRAGWPPDESDAAREFFDHVESILLEMDFHSNVAATNSSALHGIIRALSDATNRMQSLYNEWNTKEAAEAKRSTFEKIVDDATFWSNENAWRIDLNKRATSVMVATDTAISENRQRMTAPAAATPPTLDTSIDSSSDNPGATTQDDPKTAGPSNATLMHAPTISTPTTASVDVTPGPILTATSSSLTQNGSADPATTPYSDLPTSPGTPAGAPVVGRIASEEPFRRTSTQIDAQPRQPTLAPKPAGTQFLGFDGVIGGMMPPQSGARTGAPFGQISGDKNRRVNRPGGVIGDSSIANTIADAGEIKRYKGECAPPDPEDQWRADEGVPSVIAASTAERHHTGGRGIIGIDR